MGFGTTDVVPLISVVMPAYNSEKTLQPAIDSVRRQTIEEWELVVVDDCSTDNTWSILKSLSAKDSRIVTLHHTHNLGVAGARNSALAACRGRYVAFLDSDDLWINHKLEIQLKAMQDNSLAFSYTQFRTFRHDQHSPGSLIQPSRCLNYARLLRDTSIACSTVMIDTSRIKSIQFQDIRHEDFGCWLSILKRGHVAVLVPQDLMRYRRSSGSISGNKFRSAIWVWRIYRDVEHIAFAKSLWLFLCYATKALRKYMLA